jgi:hypothetical protein
MFCFGTGVIQGPSEIPPSTGYRGGRNQPANFKSGPVCRRAINEHKLNRHMRRVRAGNSGPQSELSESKQPGQSDVQLYPNATRPLTQPSRPTARTRPSQDFVTCGICPQLRLFPPFSRFLPGKHRLLEFRVSLLFGLRNRRPLGVKRDLDTRVSHLHRKLCELEAPRVSPVGSSGPRPDVANIIDSEGYENHSWCQPGRNNFRCQRIVNEQSRFCDLRMILLPSQ